MNYRSIEEGIFIERPNRFIAHVELAGEIVIVHVKNTGRCKELLIHGVAVYIQKSDNPERKTKWDLIAVQKGKRLINMDSQVPNHVIREWIESGNLFPDATLIKAEQTYKRSRFDLYIESGERKIFIEVKGVTLERDGIVLFPDAPSLRAIKHVEELCDAVKEGYEAYIIFLVQMKNVRYFTPNIETQPAFGEVLQKARKAGVQMYAFDCNVKADHISIHKEVNIVLGDPLLQEIGEPLVSWYKVHKRSLPWRQHITAYRVWVSEIMLQQTRVEAVKPFYARFLKELPTIEALAQASEERLLKLWEGLGYYNRVRNMQKAAQQVVEVYHGEFPNTYEEIMNLPGIGNYTAGAISSFAYGIPKPAVDGNVLRVISRILASDEDIMKASVRTKIENALEQVIPKEEASDFNQGLIELGAIVCVPNGLAKCEICPFINICRAKKQGRVSELPVKKSLKKRKVEKRTIIIFKDGTHVAIRKRPSKGLLAGLYELPNVQEHLSVKEVIEYSKEIGLTPIRVEELSKEKHIFSHIEWQMIGYIIRVDELEKTNLSNMLFIHPEEIEKKYPIPAAFEKYTKYMNIKLGQEKYR